MKPFFYLGCLLTLVSCSNDTVNNNNCRFLLDVGVNISINMSLPQYSQLQFINNPVYIPNVGNGGIIANNTGTGYVAFDAADPNHTLQSCSVLSIDGIEGVCGCPDKNTYYLKNGLPKENAELRCPLKAYRVEQNSNTLLIYN